MNRQAYLRFQNWLIFTARIYNFFLAYRNLTFYRTCQSEEAFFFLLPCVAGAQNEGTGAIRSARCERGIRGKGKRSLQIQLGIFDGTNFEQILASFFSNVFSYDITGHSSKNDTHFSWNPASCTQSTSPTVCILFLFRLVIQLFSASILPRIPLSIS